MPSNHLILCHPLLLPPSVFSSIRVFSSESVLCIRWPKYQSSSFSISPSNEYSGLISFRIDWFDLHAVQGTLKSLLQHHSSKASILRRSAFCIQLSHSYMTTGKTIALTRWTFGTHPSTLPSCRPCQLPLELTEVDSMCLNKSSSSFPKPPLSQHVWLWWLNLLSFRPRLLTRPGRCALPWPAHLTPPTPHQGGFLKASSPSSSRGVWPTRLASRPWPSDLCSQSAAVWKHESDPLSPRLLPVPRGATCCPHASFGPVIPQDCAAQSPPPEPACALPPQSGLHPWGALLHEEGYTGLSGASA